MKQYELTIIAPEDLTVVSKVELEKMIKRYARITKRMVEGVKRLAYPIQGKERGLYLYYDLEMEGDRQVKLSSNLNINDSVVRYLLVIKDTRR